MQIGRTTRHLDDVPVHWGVIKTHASAHISAAGEELDEGRLLASMTMEAI
jgi:hypothetical protein